MEDVYTIKTSAFPSTARVVAFRGAEAISRPFRFEVFVNLPADDAKSLDLVKSTGAKATLSMHDERSDAFVFQGILSVVELVHAHAQYALLRAVLEPRFVRLKLTEHSRMFTNQSLPDIWKAVLQENGLTSDDFALQLTGTYAPEEHVCQYHESDFDFVSRWMEHLGVHYFFEHDGEHEKMIITDDKSAHSAWPSKPVRYFPSLGKDRSSAPGLETFRSRATSLPASVKLKDYDYTKPTLDVSGTANVASNGVGEVSVYGVRAFTPSDASAFAKIRAEELLARQLEHTGSSTVILRAGYTFSLEEHPIDAFNAKYLATDVEHFGNLVGDSPELATQIDVAHPDVYRCVVTAVPDKVSFRPVRATPWPRIYGFEHGIIDGEADSDYAQIDDHGRYKVKFTFDESDLKDGKGSTWVRMMQPHGGGVEGFHFPQRKNTEVVFAFMGGDPDRPVIAGVVNNTTTPSPVTSGNNTKNVIQTGGRNRMEMEDQDGQQRVTFSCPTATSYIRFGAANDDHNMIISTTGPTLLITPALWNVDVGSLHEKVKDEVTETYSSTQTSDVTGLVHETYHAGQLTEVSGGARELQVTGDLTEHCTGTAKQDYDAAHNLTTGPRVDHVKGTMGQTIDGAHTLTTGARTDHVKGTLDITADGPITITTPKKTETITGPSDLITNSTKATITMGATFSADLSASLSMFAGLKTSLSASINLSATAAVKCEFNAGPNLRESTIDGIIAAAVTTIAAGDLIALEAPVLSITAAEIVLL